MAIIGHYGTPFPLPDTAFVSEAKGQNQIAQSLVGRARTAYELLTGEVLTGEPAATNKNPQRNIGHDHSGPPFGSAFCHPVAWWSWAKDSANLQQPSNPLGNIAAGEHCRTGNFCFWNRPFAPLPSPWLPPYSRLFLYFIAFRDSGAGNTDMGVRIESLGDSTDPDAQSETVSITGNTTPTGYVTATAYLPAHGGRNVCCLQFTPATVALHVTGWCLMQVRKRSHASASLPNVP